MKKLLYGILLVGATGVYFNKVLDAPLPKQEKQIETKVPTKTKKSSFFVTGFVLFTILTGLFSIGRALPVKPHMEEPFQDLYADYSGFYTIGSDEYYFENGQKVTGFKTNEMGEAIYVKDGLVLKGRQQIDDLLYIFDEKTGAQQFGWMLDSERDEIIPILTKEECKEETCQKSGVEYTIQTNNGEVVEVLPKNVPYFSQIDERWSAFELGDGGSIHERGCGPTVATSVINYLLGESLTPKELAELFYSWDHYNGKYGHGIDSGVWRKFAEHYNLYFRNHLSEQEIKDELRKGNLIVAHMGLGTFVHNGGTHVVLAYGLNKKNETHVYDPFREYQNGIYPVALLFKEQAKEEIDVLDDGPFYAIGKKDNND